MHWSFPPTIRKNAAATMRMWRKSLCRWRRLTKKRQGLRFYDVSNPQGARRAGLQDWPGFDLQSSRPARGDRPAEVRAIEVKGRARTGGVQLQENEWRKACILGKEYWLYVVLDCDTPQPTLLRICDPFDAFVVGKREISSYTIPARIAAGCGGVKPEAQACHAEAYSH